MGIDLVRMQLAAIAVDAEDMSVAALGAGHPDTARIMAVVARLADGLSREDAETLWSVAAEFEQLGDWATSEQAKAEAQGRDDRAHRMQAVASAARSSVAELRTKAAVEGRHAR